MARSNLHQLSSRLLATLDSASADGHFEGKLRAVATEAGLNPVRSAEAVRLLEDLGRIEVEQRGRRGRDTIIRIASTAPVSEDEAAGARRKTSAPSAARLSYDDIGRAVVDRLLELARDDGLRAAQVEAFAAEATGARARIAELEEALEAAQERETDVRVRLRSAEEALRRAEENLRRAVGSNGRAGRPADAGVPDDEAQAVLDILRSGRV